MNFIFTPNFANIPMVSYVQKHTSFRIQNQDNKSTTHCDMAIFLNPARVKTGKIFQQFRKNDEHTLQQYLVKMPQNAKPMELCIVPEIAGEQPSKWETNWTPHCFN
jgi:hypothetical protein